MNGYNEVVLAAGRGTNAIRKRFGSERGPNIYKEKPTFRVS